MPVLLPCYGGGLLFPFHLPALPRAHYLCRFAVVPHRPSLPALFYRAFTYVATVIAVYYPLIVLPLPCRAAYPAVCSPPCLAALPTFPFPATPLLPDLRCLTFPFPSIRLPLLRLRVPGLCVCVWMRCRFAVTFVRSQLILVGYVYCCYVVPPLTFILCLLRTDSVRFFLYCPQPPPRLLRYVITCHHEFTFCEPLLPQQLHTTHFTIPHSSLLLVVVVVRCSHLLPPLEFQFDVLIGWLMPWLVVVVTLLRARITWLLWLFYRSLLCCTCHTVEPVFSPLPSPFGGICILCLDHCYSAMPPPYITLLIIYWLVTYIYD